MENNLTGALCGWIAVEDRIININTGILITNTSPADGRSSATAWNAPATSPHSPTTAKPGSDSTSSRSPLRTTTWSSASTTVSVLSICCVITT